MAWQRDAAKAGAPLSREPLATLKAQLADRVKGIEDLQHRVQVQREAAVLLAQRIEVLSTKSWRDAQAAAGVAGHRRARLAGPGAGAADGSELGQRRHQVSARCWKRRARSCRWCGTRSRAPWRRPWRRPRIRRRRCRRCRCGPTNCGRRAACRWRRAAKPAKPKVDPEVRAQAGPGRARGAGASWNRRSRRATARPVPARPPRCAMRSRNTAS